MRRNIIQPGGVIKNGKKLIENDWCNNGIPSNVMVAEDAYIDTSFCFGSFFSEKKPGMIIGNSTGVYDRCNFMTGPVGKIVIGNFCMLNGTNIISNLLVEIGNYCMISWGTFISDSTISPFLVEEDGERNPLISKSDSSQRTVLPDWNNYAPVSIADGAWIGFGAVVMPGVNIGKYAIVGCRSVVYEDVPDFAIVAGDPARLIRFQNGDGIINN